MHPLVSFSLVELSDYSLPISSQVTSRAALSEAILEAVEKANETVG
jgi:hypothetical protein